MSLRALQPISTAPMIVEQINRTRYRQLNPKPTNRSRSIDTRKKFTPRTNKSFICYKEVPTINISTNNRSFSVERTKHFLNRLISPSNRTTHLRTRNLRSTSKLVAGHPGPGDLEGVQDLEHKHELITAWLEKGNEHFNKQEYTEAIRFFKKTLKKEKLQPEALLKKSLSLIYQRQHKEAVSDLETLIREYPLYNKDMYTALATCYVSSGDYITAVRQITKGLLKFPRFVSGFITRGQIYNEEQKWDKAVTDFYKAITLSPAEGTGYMGLAEALVGMNDKKNAVKMLAKAAQCENTAAQALMKKATINYETGNLKESLEDLEQSLKLNPENAEAYYYRALVLLVNEQLTDAALSLEQVIKYDLPEKKFTGAAIYNLGAIKIKERDFYGAMHTFKRASDIRLEVPEQKVLKSYVEAVLSLMKRHFKEGIDQFSKIIKRKHPILVEYMGNCHAYRGYGLASIEKHELAVKEFSAAAKLKAMDEASRYNQLLSQGICVSEKSLEGALEVFLKAEALFEKNIEPLAYEAAVLFTMAVKSFNKEAAVRARALLDQAIELREGESDLHYFRSIVLYYLGKPIEAIPDMEIAIDKAEDNMPIHFLTKGLCYAQLKLYKEAIHDFTIVLELDENFADAYFFRGRCAFILNDTNLAFADYEKLILAKSEDPLVHVHAGDLLLLIGSTEDAIKAYSNANSTEETSAAFLEQAKAYLILEDLESSIEALNEAIRIENSPEFQFDKTVLESLSSAIDEKIEIKERLKSVNIQLNKALKMNKEGKICTMKHVHWLKGSFYFFTGEYIKASTEFQAAIGNSDKQRLMGCESPDLILEKENAELLYNLSLCYIMEQEYESALMHLCELVHYSENSNKGKVLLILGLLQLGLDQHKEARTLMTEGFQYDPDTLNHYLQEEDEVKVLPFAADSNFAENFPLTQLQIGDCHPVFLRPSVNIPKAPFPQLEFGVEKQVLENFKIKAVKCRPEAPWLNRVKGSIEFTDEVRDIVSEEVSCSEASEPDSIEDSESVFDFKVKRKYRSAIELPRRDESELESHAENTANLINEAMLKEEAPDEIAKRIQAMCSPNEDSVQISDEF